MTTINETARTVLSVLRGIAELGGGQHLTSTFTPEVRALLAHLDGKVPGLMSTWLSGEERCNGITVRSPDNYDQLSFQMVAPSCYEPSASFRLAAEVEAYHELERLAVEPSTGPQPTPQAMLIINDAAEAFAGTFGAVAPQFSVGPAGPGKLRVSIELVADVAGLNALAGALAGS